MPTRNIAIILPKARTWTWHRKLISRLSQFGGVDVFHSEAVGDYPRGIIRWMEFERWLLGDYPDVRLEAVDGRGQWLNPGPGDYQIVVNLSETDVTVVGSNVLHIRYNGECDSVCLMTTLMSQQCPQLAVHTASPDGRPVATSHVSIQDKIVLVRGLQAAFSRLMVLIERSVRFLICARSETVPVRLDREPIRFTLGLFGLFLFRFVVDKCFKSLLRRMQIQEYWSVAVLPGLPLSSDLTRAGAIDCRDLAFLENGRDQCFADPFLFEHTGRRWLFVEQISHATLKGSIACVEIHHDGQFGTPRVVLERPYHLSYPFVFKHKNDVFMMPETGANRTVELYKPERFPDQWVLHRTLLADVSLYDATILAHGSKLWLFCASACDGNPPQDELVIYFSDDIEGPWRPHPLNPVKSDCRSARPAGQILIVDGRLFRPAQNCEQGYGTGITWLEIKVLTEESYLEIEIGHWSGADLGETGMHTFNQLRGLATVDVKRAAWKPFF